MWSFLVPATLALSLLGGCGNRGGLVLPPRPQAVPAAVVATAAVVAAPPASVADADRTAAGDPTRNDSSTAAAETER